MFGCENHHESITDYVMSRFVLFLVVFGAKHLGMSIFEKEYLSIINAVDKLRAYRLRRHFTIRIDHHNLKFLLEKKSLQLCSGNG